MERVEKISVIVLSRNEEKNITGVVNDILKNVRGDIEVLVVDDSTDRTPKLVREMSAQHPNVKLVPQVGKGFTNAFITALNNFTGDAVVFLVGDTSDEVSDINRLKANINKGYDIVCASRHMEGGSKTGGSLLQGLFSSFVGMSLHVITGVPTSDISNSFKMYRRKVFDAITPVESSFSVSMQVALRAYVEGFSMTEIPTVWKNRAEGTSNFSMTGQARHYMYWYIWGIINSLRVRA